MKNSDDELIKLLQEKLDVIKNKYAKDAVDIIIDLFGDRINEELMYNLLCYIASDISYPVIFKLSLQRSIRKRRL